MTVLACAFAQTNKGGIPAYKILKPDGSYSRASDLKKGKLTMIVYFMPDCPHCQELTKALTANMARLKDVQIVMITCTKTEYPYMRLIQDFQKTYRLTKYKNIVMGSEYPSYLVNDYYGIQGTPFVALYNKAGEFIKSYLQPKGVSEILNELKKVS